MPQGAGEPVKFLGCGICDSISKSVTLASAVDSARDLAREGRAMLREMRVPWEDIRGLGLQVRCGAGRGPAPGAWLWLGG